MNEHMRFCFDERWGSSVVLGAVWSSGSARTALLPAVACSRLSFLGTCSELLLAGCSALAVQPAAGCAALVGTTVISKVSSVVCQLCLQFLCGLHNFAFELFDDFW